MPAGRLGLSGLWLAANNRSLKNRGLRCIFLNQGIRDYQEEKERYGRQLPEQLPERQPDP
jgi:hypothetical protein